MSWLEYLGVILVLLVFSLAVLTVTRLHRAITFWFWAWAAQLGVAAIFSTLADSMIAVASAAGLVLLAPTLHLAGTIAYARGPAPAWIVPAGVAIATTQAILYAGGAAETQRYFGAVVTLAAYGWAIYELAHAKTSKPWLNRCLIAGFIGLASIAVYDAAVEIYLQEENIGWPLWMIVGVFMGATQIQAAVHLVQSDSRDEVAVSARTAVDRFDAMVRHARDIIAEVSADGRLCYVSPNVKQVLGYSPEELLGQPFHGRLRPAAEKNNGSQDKGAVDLAKAVSAGPYDTLYRSVTKSGDEVWLEIEASHYFTPDAELRAVAIIRDVTEREILHRQHTESQNLESLGVLAGGVAHDFNNLLTAILGNANIARDSIPNHSPAQAPIEQIEKAASRAAELTSKLLAYAGKTPMSIADVDVTAVANETQQILRSALPKNTHVHWQPPTSPMHAQADATLLMQVIVNLMTNASEALEGKAGNIHLELARASQTQAKRGDDTWAIPPESRDYVVLTVRDEGSGMDADTRRRIFEPFFSSKFIGRGLGLSAVLGIVRDHQGALRVESTPEVGTTVSVYLPSTDQSTQVAATPPLEKPAWHVSGLALVVDDELAVRTVVQRMLERIGFDVVSAADGGQAMERVTSHGDALRLVLLDVTMPGISTRETVLDIHAANPSVPIVLMSGYDENAATRELAEHGVAGFLKKPFRIDAAILAIRDAIGEPAEVP